MDVDKQQAMRPVDRSSPIPYYYQLQEILKQEIENGRWKPGEMLPPERELTTFFGVSRTVTRKALDILEGDGQVYRVNGKGTVVAQPKFRYEGVGAAWDWSIGEHVDPTLSTVVAIQSVQVGGQIGNLLGLSPSDDVFELTFVQSVDTAPASLTQMFLRRDATPELTQVEAPFLEESAEEVLIQLRRRYGLHIFESQLSIEATRTNAYEAELLQIRPDSPVFLLSAIEIASHGVPVAFSRSVVRSDHFRFSVVLRYADHPTSPGLGGAIRADRSWSYNIPSRP